MRAARFGLATLFLVLAGCGDGGTDPTPGGNNNTGGTNTCASTSTNVTVQNNSFSPSCTRVPAGSTVTWTWAATAVTHNVTFQSGASSGNQDSGTFQRGFPNTGTFAYECTLHPGMSGTIRVE